MKFGKEPAIVSNNDLTQNLYTMKNINGKINTNFNNNEIRKEGSQCICLSVILIDSVYRRDINYCTEAFLE